MFTNYRSLRRVPQADLDVFTEVFNIGNLVWAYERAHPKKKPIYRCHSVCRALVEVLPSLKVVDGHYLGAKHILKKGRVDRLKFLYYPHSWLVTPTGSIIDPYPVACFTQPILVVTRGRSSPCGKGLYIPNPDLTKQFMRPKVIEETAVFTAHLKKLLKKKGQTANKK